MDDLLGEDLLERAKNLNKKKKDKFADSDFDKDLPEDIQRRRKRSYELQEKEAEEIRSQIAVSTTPTKPGQSVFNFLLTKDYKSKFLEYLSVYNTLTDPENPKSPRMLTRVKFLELVKKLKPDDLTLQRQEVSNFRKWLIRNGFGTDEQMEKQFIDQKRERSRMINNRAQVQHLIEILVSDNELLDSLLDNDYFIKKLASKLKGVR